MTARYTSETVPHLAQKHWVDERDVIITVTQCVPRLKYSSTRDEALERYAKGVRRWYAHASDNGKDVDAGVRALNYVHKIHKDAKGARSLWKKVLKEARALTDADGLPPPEGYK